MRGSRDTEDVGSGLAEVEVLNAATVQRVATGQDRAGDADGPPCWMMNRHRPCLSLDEAAATAAGGDAVFEQLPPGIIEPLPKLDAVQVLERGKPKPVLYRSVKHRPPTHTETRFTDRSAGRQTLASDQMRLGAATTRPGCHHIGSKKPIRTGSCAGDPRKLQCWFTHPG